MTDNKGIFKASYISTNEILEEQALKNKYFDAEYYDTAKQNNQGYEYLSVMASLTDNMSPTFNETSYNKLTDKSDKFNYLVVENLYDKNSEEYRKATEQFNQKFEQIKREEIFNGLSDFEKAVNSIGGIVGNAFNQLIGVIEGLLDISIAGSASAASIFDKNAAEVSKQFIAADVTGYASNQKEISEWINTYTWVDKNDVLKTVDNVASGIVRMAPLLIPVAGQGIYYASMAGNTAEEVIKSNPDINYWAMLGYAAATTSLEAGIEWASGKFLKFDVLGSKLSGNKALSTGSWITDMGFNFLSEGVEEMASEIGNSILYNLMIDPTADSASIQDVLYAGLIGGITGSFVTGGAALSTTRYAVKNGQIMSLSAAELEYLKNNPNAKLTDKRDYKKVGFGKSYQIGKAMEAFNTEQVSEKTKLMIKYNKLTEDQIKTQHSLEWSEAVAKDEKTDNIKTKATKDLITLMNTIGVEQFNKSAELLNQTFEKQKQYVDNFLNNTNTSNKIASDLFGNYYPGMSATVKQASDVELDIARAIQQTNPGMKVVFVDYGAKEGDFVGQKVNIIDNYMYIESGYAAKVGMESVLDNTIRQVITNDILNNTTEKERNDLIKALTPFMDIESDPTINTALSKKPSISQAKDAHKASIQQILYEDAKISKLLQINKKLHKNMYKMILKSIDKNKIKRKNDAVKKELNELLKIKNRYIKSLADYIASATDIEIAISEYNLNADESNYVKTNVKESYLNAPYALMKTDHTKNTARRYDLERFLVGSRALDNLMEPFDYTRSLDETYYDEFFVARIKNAQKNSDFRRAMFDYVLNNYGFTLNPIDGEIYEAVNLQTKTTWNFVYWCVNRNNVPNRVFTISDIITDEFLTSRFSEEELNKIRINFISDTDGDVISGTTNYKDPNNIKITIKLKTQNGKTMASGDQKLHVVLHEILHAFSFLQGLPRGANLKSITRFVRNMSMTHRRYVANLALDKKYIENHSEEDVIDTLSRAIYRHVDGELLAEGQITQTYRGDIGDYFVIKNGVLIGRGKFRPITGKLYDVESTSQYINASKKVKQGALALIKNELRKQQITNLKEYGFSEEFIDSLTSNTLDKDLIVNLLNEKQTVFKKHPKYPKQTISEEVPNATGIGNQQATNFIINILYPNASLKTIEDINTFVELLPTLTYMANSEYADTLFEALSTQNISDMRDDITSYAEKNADKKEYIKTVYNVSENLDKDTNKRRLISFILTHNIQINPSDIRKLAKAISSSTGLSGLKFVTQSTDEVKSGKNSEMTSQYGEEDSRYDLGDTEDETIDDNEQQITETDLGNVDTILKSLHPDDIGITIKESVEKYITSILSGTAQNIGSFEQIIAIRNNEKIRNMLSEHFGKAILSELDQYTSKEFFLATLNDVVKNASKADIDKLRQYFTGDKSRKSRLISLYGKTINTDIKSVLQQTYISKDTKTKIVESVKKQIAPQAKSVEKSAEQTPQEPVAATTAPTETVGEQISFFGETAKPVKQQVEKRKTRIKKTLALDKAPEETIQQAVTADITTDKSLDIVDKLEQFVEANASKKYSQYQAMTDEELTETKLREYISLSDDMSKKASFLIKHKKDYAKIRTELLARDTELSRASVNFLDYYMYKYASSDPFVRTISQQQTTLSAQKLGLRGVYAKRYAPVNKLVTELEKKGISIYDKLTKKKLLEIVGKYDARIANRSAELKKAKQQIKDLEAKLVEIGKTQEKISYLNEQIQTLTNQLLNATPAETKTITSEIKKSQTELNKLNAEVADQSILLDDLTTINDTVNILESNDSVAMADWAIRTTTDANERAQKEASMIKDITDEVLESTTYEELSAAKSKHKGDYPVAFPKATAKLKKVATTLKTVRYTAMLSSPVTMIRNKVNNTMMVGLDKATKAIERRLIESTKSAEQYKDVNQFQLTDKVDVDLQNHIKTNYYKTIFDTLGSEKNRYDATASSQTIKNIETKVQKKSDNAIVKGLAYAQDFIYKGLETGPLGDRPTLTDMVIENMTMFVTANKDKILTNISTKFGTIEQIKKKKSIPNDQKVKLIKALTTQNNIDVLEAVMTDEDYFSSTIMRMSSERACEQLFKNDNMFSDILRKAADKSPVADVMIGVVMPFYKVGSNILSMAYKYSPLNFVSALKKMSIAEQVTSEDYKGRIRGTEVAEKDRAFAQASIGTALWIAGIIAANIGLIDYDDDDYLGPAVNMFGVRVGLSNAAPALTTLSLGAVLTDSLKKGEGVNINKIADVLYSNTLLGNIENIFKYDTESTLEGVTVSYLTSYIPAVMKLITKVTDPYSRDKTGDLGDKLWKSTLAAIPGLSYMVPSKINAYSGQSQTRYGSADASFWGMIENIIGAINPFDISYEDKYLTDIQKEAERLNVPTSGVTGRFTYNGTDVAVLGTEKENIAKFRANYINNQYSKIVNDKQLVTVETEDGKRITTTYSKLTDKQKQNVINKLYTDGSNYAKIKYWIDSGNSYYTSNQTEYNNLINILGKNNKIIYKKTWSKSKFVEA